YAPRLRVWLDIAGSGTSPDIPPLLLSRSHRMEPPAIPVSDPSARGVRTARWRGTAALRGFWRRKIFSRLCVRSRWMEIAERRCVLSNSEANWESGNRQPAPDPFSGNGRGAFPRVEEDTHRPASLRRIRHRIGNQHTQRPQYDH